eukprot:jgi/Galph1/5575/GphlegSOOS_G4291.1
MISHLVVQREKRNRTCFINFSGSFSSHILFPRTAGNTFLCKECRLPVYKRRKSLPSNGRSVLCCSPVDIEDAVVNNTLKENGFNEAMGALQAHRMIYQELSWSRKLLRTLRLFFSLRRRLSRGTVLQLQLADSLPEATSSPLESVSVTSLFEITENIRKAAHDPRIAAIYVKVSPLTCGFAKIAELCRHLDYFRQSGKKVYGYLENGTEKEILLSLFMDELYIAPEASISLRGFKVSATFLRDFFEKIGLEPQVERFGVYKSAGDQFSRRNMSSEQREVLNNILNAFYNNFCLELSDHRNFSLEKIRQVLDSAPYKTSEIKELGLVTDLKYESEVYDMLKLRYANKGKGLPASASVEQKNKVLKKPLRYVSSKIYSRTKPRKLALEGKKRIGIIRASGAIVSGESGRNPLVGSTIGSDSLVALLREAADNPKLAAIVLRIDSPGGSALASDIIWGEILRLREKKPIVASMSDVAASGGYYISMACNHICCEPLTLTGSIGVVTAKFSLQHLYDRLGLVKETISIGKFAELDIETRSFNEEERKYFRESAYHAYHNFVSKAASSRNFTYQELDTLAQGRVWLGYEALQHKLVDSCGGIWKAIEVAKTLASIDHNEPVRLVEMNQSTLLSILAGSLFQMLRYFGVETSSSERKMLTQLNKYCKIPWLHFVFGFEPLALLSFEFSDSS